MTDLAVLLQQLAGISTDWLWAGLLVFLRVGAVMALMPAFGEQSVPARVRLVLALAFTAVTVPAVSAKLPLSVENPALWLVSEAVAGLAIGIGLRLFVLALQIAGAMAAQAASLAQVFGGATPEPQPAIGNLLVIAGLALAVATGLHVKVAALLILSYDAMPPGHLLAASDLAQWGVAQIARAFGLGFSLAAPFVIASVIYNVALGVINRAMPQLSVAFVGAPALTAGALVLLGLVAPFALAIWLAAFDSFLADPFSLPR